MKEDNNWFIGIYAFIFYFLVYNKFFGKILEKFFIISFWVFLEGNEECN